MVASLSHILHSEPILIGSMRKEAIKFFPADFDLDVKEICNIARCYVPVLPEEES